MGDNRSNSTDSRSQSLGPVPDYSIFGIESYRIWPITEFQIFEKPVFKYEPISDAVKNRKEQILNQNNISLKIGPLDSSTK
jgi:hypothetical protein